VLEKSPPPDDPGIIHQDVSLAEEGDRFADHPLYCFTLRDIGLDSLGIASQSFDLLRYLLGTFQVYICNNHICPFLSRLKSVF
jgi:hypothetical protein